MRNTQTSEARQNRSNPDRYFQVLTKGWFIFTREGIKGPFSNRRAAVVYLADYLDSAYTGTAMKGL